MRKRLQIFCLLLLPCLTLMGILGRGSPAALSTSSDAAIPASADNWGLSFPAEHETPIGKDVYKRQIPLLIQLLEEPQHLPARPGIQRAGGLIRQNDRGIPRQRSCDGYPLLLTAGELTGQVLSLIHI